MHNRPERAFYRFTGGFTGCRRIGRVGGELVVEVLKAHLAGGEPYWD